MSKKYRRQKITLTVVKALKAGEFVLDAGPDSQPGFGVRRQTVGAHYFVRRKVQGRQLYQSLGRHGDGDLTVETARDRARELVALWKAGSSPVAERLRRRSMPTVATFLDAWMKDRITPRRAGNTANGYAVAVRDRIKPKFGTTPVDVVARKDVEAWHAGMNGEPSAANYALAVFSSAMKAAIQRDLRRDNPCATIERFRETARDRYLSAEELQRVGAVIKAIEPTADPFQLGAICFLLFSGLRKREALGLRWDDVDLDERTLRLRETKTGTRRVAVNDAMASVLEKLPRMKNPHVFVGRVTGKPLSDIDTLWRHIRKLAGVEDVRVHDLRHTLATSARSAGLPLDQVGHLLGHADLRSTKRYADVTTDAARSASNLATSGITKHLEKK